MSNRKEDVCADFVDQSQYEIKTRHKFATPNVVRVHKQILKGFPIRGVYFLWGHVRENVYANSSASIQDLIDGIREAIEDIGQPLCDLVMENFIERIWSCKRGRGGHLSDVIFHY